MKELTNLFKLIEITRTQPQYGYGLRGIRQNDLSNLAEHHYLVTFMAWQISKHLIAKGAKLDLAKVLEISLMHDLGELFGGDISRPYAVHNPRARRLAKAFEEENQRFLSSFFDLNKKEFKLLWEQVRKPSTNEGIISKIADYMECGHYLKYMDLLKPLDIRIVKDKVPAIIEKLKDPVAKLEMKVFFIDWVEDLQKVGTAEILFG